MADTALATLLNVNDTEANRYATTRTLQRAGFEVIEADSGSQALALINTRLDQIDLVLLDVNLPDISGLEVCRQLKAAPETRSIPVLQVSATAIELEDRVQGLESGADGYLTQDVQPSELIATVNALLRARRAERALRESELQYRGLVEALPQMVWTTDTQGNPTYFNQRWCSYTGLSLEECKGDGWVKAVHPDDAARAQDSWSGAVRTGETYEVAMRLRSAQDGTYRWYLSRGIPLRDTSGRIVRWLGTCTDIDDQERARRSLEETEQLKNNFLAMLGHELRNPLAPLMSAAQLLRARSHDSALVEHEANIIDRQVRHIVRLVDDLLDVARINQNRISIRLELLDLRELIDRAVENCQSQAQDREHEIQVVAPTEPLMVNTDPVRLQQVISNLLHNAIKYTPVHGQIRIGAAQEGDQVVLRVSDTGVGILSEMLPRVFDSFVQADRSLDRSEGGLGIGLTLVKQIVELHGGSVEASSAGADQGSEFVVRLPLVGGGTDTRTPFGSGLSAPAGACTPRRVLLVEDNADAVETLADLMELWGHEVQVAYTGEEGLERAAGHRPDVVLIDIGLPGMNGYELGRRLREMPELRCALLVALTGYGAAEDRRRSSAAGFDLHLTKPIEPEGLRHLLETEPRSYERLT